LNITIKSAVGTASGITETTNKLAALQESA